MGETIWLPPSPKTRGGAPLSILAGAVTAAAAVGVGLVLAVVFAATMAVIALLTTALLGLTGLALRFRRRRRPAGVVIEARRVGHGWVAYGWDQPSR
jgi:hypothetical protein